MKGQAMERCKIPLEDNLKCQDKAIELEELNAKESGKPKSDLLGRLYSIKSQLLDHLGKTDDAAKTCQQAIDVYRNLPGDNSVVIQKLESFYRSRAALSD